MFQGAVMVGGQISLSGNNGVTFGSTVHVVGNFSTTGNSPINLGSTLYVKGAISMAGNSSAAFSGGHAVIAEGAIQLTGNTQLAAEEIPMIISTDSTVTTAGNNWVSAIVYAPNGTITLSGGSNLYGSAVGQCITSQGNSDIIYPIGLRNREDLPRTSTGGTHVSSLTIRNYAVQ